MRHPYSLYSNRRKELDLRLELNKTLMGSSEEIAKGQIGLLRKIRRDDNDNKIPCSCRSNLTDEQDIDYYCRFCLGIGYFWDEVKIVYYRNDDSFRKIEEMEREYPRDNFYFRYNGVITTDDLIVILKTDLDGNLISPVARESIFEIISADHFKADNARVEFWHIRGKERRDWSVWYGVQPK